MSNKKYKLQYERSVSHLQQGKHWEVIILSTRPKENNNYLESHTVS